MRVTYTFTVDDGTINVCLLRETSFFHYDRCRLILKTLIYDRNIDVGKKLNTSNERARRDLSFDDIIITVLYILAA